MEDDPAPWDLVPFMEARLLDLDQVLSAKYGGTHYEFRLRGERAPFIIEARKVPIAEHEHKWSGPIDELGGRPVCLFPGCGHIATRAERFQVFLESRGRRTERA